MSINQEERGLGARRASDHILQKFLVPGRVNNNVAAFWSFEPDLSGIYRDVLVALSLQSIHQICPFERHSAPRGNLLQLLQFAFRQGASVMEQPANESGFAMVHVTDDDDLKLLD